MLMWLICKGPVRQRDDTRDRLGKHPGHTYTKLCRSVQQNHGRKPTHIEATLLERLLQNGDEQVDETLLSHEALSARVGCAVTRHGVHAAGLLQQHEHQADEDTLDATPLLTRQRPRVVAQAPQERVQRRFGGDHLQDIQHLTWPRSGARSDTPRTGKEGTQRRRHAQRRQATSMPSCTHTETTDDDNARHDTAASRTTGAHLAVRHRNDAERVLGDAPLDIW